MLPKIEVSRWEGIFITITTRIFRNGAVRTFMSRQDGNGKLIQRLFFPSLKNKIFDGSNFVSGL